MKCKVLILFLLLLSCSKEIDFNEAKIQSTLWVQNSAEYEVLCRQSYNHAAFLLNQNIRSAKGSKPLAIITDIDETILDNSPYQAAMIKYDFDYPKHWNYWCSKSEAKEIPGALEFLKIAHKKKVRIFYVSNRSEILLKETILNLQKIGFPSVSKETVLLRTKSDPDKEDRRSKIMENYKVILFIGDKMSDLIEIFDNKSTEDRNILAKDLSDLISKKFIIIPNPMYGDWEQAVYKYDYSASRRKKRELEMESLESFNNDL